MDEVGRKNAAAAFLTGKREGVRSGTCEADDMETGKLGTVICAVKKTTLRNFGEHCGDCVRLIRRFGGWPRRCCRQCEG